MTAKTDARKAGGALRRNSAQMGSYFFVTALILFSRNLVIARLIGPEEFGTASAIALLASMIEMGTGLGLDRLAIQARDGATPRMQASLQGMQALRGLAGSLAMLLLAMPYALFLNVPAATATFACLACVPLLRGLVHMDVFRTQRHGRFGSFIAPEGGVIGIGSGGNYALAAARAIMHQDLEADEIARRAIFIAR
ncbi:MAG: oligosaccharide flippase family protein, partial [Pseudomonadota bacterium]